MPCNMANNQMEPPRAYLSLFYLTNVGERGVRWRGQTAYGHQLKLRPKKIFLISQGGLRNSHGIP